MLKVGAREILVNENKMLEILVAVINAFAEHYKDPDDDFQFQNLSCWGKELSGYHDVNDKYRGKDDDELRAALQEEIGLLNACLTAIKDATGDAAEYWKTNLRENIWYTEKTLERV